MSALIITAVMRSLAEMVSVRPFAGALMDFPATFVDPALGFTVGVTYWYVAPCVSSARSADGHYRRFAQCISMAALTSAAVRLVGTFYTDGSPLSTGGKAAITAALLVVTLLANVCGVKVWNLYVANSSGKSVDFLQLYGNLERTFKIFKVILILFLFIFMIAVNLGRKFNTTAPR